MRNIYILLLLSIGWGANQGDIIITEFFFNKSAGNLPEYVELFNKTESTIDLNGWKLDIDGIQVEIDVTFNIAPQDYVVILSSSGLFRSEDGTTYCSSSNYGFPFNVCDVTVDELFWRIGTFSDLSNDSGTIKIWDNSDTPNVIDSVTYSSEANFPVGDDIFGMAAEFIQNPLLDSSHLLNDIGENWQSSQNPSEWLWNGSSHDYGSPLSVGLYSFGCTDPEACNYDEEATADDGSCEYEVDCAGDCPPIEDCPDEFSFIEGCAQIDECNICVGGATERYPCEQDCIGEWGGSAYEDNCNQCIADINDIDCFNASFKIYNSIGLEEDDFIIKELDTIYVALHMQNLPDSLEGIIVQIDYDSNDLSLIDSKLNPGEFDTGLTIPYLLDSSYVLYETSNNGTFLPAIYLETTNVTYQGNDGNILFLQFSNLGINGDSTVISYITVQVNEHVMQEQNYTSQVIYFGDCYGVFNGETPLDECGVCGGDNSSCSGCTDPEACNYDSLAIVDDESCTYAEENYDCDGNCIALDACGNCGGNCYDPVEPPKSRENFVYCSSVEDEPNNLIIADECGVCDGDGVLSNDYGDCECQLVGVVFADCSGVCGGNDLSCADCAGVPDGDADEDECGVCLGDGSTCTGCMDDTACNYDIDATLEGDCTYPETYYNCNGSCINDSNEDGVCDELSLFNEVIPDNYSIHSIYPNPFNPVTSITYGLPEHANVQIVVYDLSGKQVATLISEFQTPGYHSVNWNADNLPSGVYLIRMDSGDFTQTQKVVLVK